MADVDLPSATVARQPGNMSDSSISPPDTTAELQDSHISSGHDQDAQHSRRDANDEAQPQDSLPIPSITMTGLHNQPGANVSMLHPDSDDFEGHSAQFDEHEMRVKLGDLESSFLPHDPLPLGHARRQQDMDDSFLEARTADGMGGGFGMDGKHDGQRSPSTNPSAYQTPYTTRQPFTEAEEVYEAEHAGDTTSELETMSSSPTAAAASRLVTRAISTASRRSTEDEITERLELDGLGDDETYDEETPMPTRTRQVVVAHQESDDESMSTIQHHESGRERGRLALDAGSTPGAALLGRKLSTGRGSRPRFLSSRSRDTSQRSSTSSLPRSDRSDVSFGADFALATGGALPENGLSRNSSYHQARSLSLSDLASENGDYAEQGVIERPLAILTEEEERSRPSTAIKVEDYHPVTPRGRESMTAPTDTVIARHVSNVIIPDSVAREYRSKHVKSPSKNLPSALTRNGKNMTLKEQSSSIERLSKENFDLKLKVMFLSDRLDKLSEEGVKETIRENVELKTALANLQRDNKALRKKNKELETKAKEDGERPGTAKSGASSNFDHGQQWSDQEGAEEREEELIYLRERVEEYVTEIEHLQAEALTREAEKRRMAETVKAMGQGRSDSFEAREEMDVWRDLLEQESARREQAEEDSRRLREEIFKMKTEATSGLNHTTNIYNITKKRQMSPSRPQSQFSERYDDRNGTYSTASTLFEDLQRERDLLKQENDALRREIGAQTSMLTSRNREKDRLYQEIEDLKLGQRRNGGGSIAGDSILERSASRAHARSASRASSSRAKQSGLDEAEREEYEAQLAELRDKINEHRLRQQEVQTTLAQTEEDFELHLEEKEKMESDMLELATTIEALEEDIQAMQAERDDVLQQNEQLEIDLNDLKDEAEIRIKEGDLEIEQRMADIEKLTSELANKTENFAALQNEMRSMSDGLIRLEDDQEAKLKRIRELEEEVEAGNREFEELQRHFNEANEKIERLQIQQENSAGEISFLREEQEGDKVKIGELETAFAALEKSLADEVRHVKELTEHHENERSQWAEIDGKNKEQTNNFINSLNRQIEMAKDDARKAHLRAQNEETESAAWKARLQELEDNLGVALGNLHGTRASLLKSVEELQRQMEKTSMELSDTRNKLNEQTRIVKQRDALLESHSLESRKLNDSLDKERQLHRSTKHQFDAFQKQHAHANRTLSQQEARVLELEAGKAADRKKLIQLENSFKDQLTERNNLLLVLWNRLSALCGSDWAHDNSLINGRALPTLEVIMNMLPGFSKNLFAAVKCIETIVGNFKTKVKAVERDMLKEVHNLEMTLDSRTRKLNHLELVVKSGGFVNPAGGFGTPTSQIEMKAELAKLRDANKALRSELANARNLDLSSRGLVLLDEGVPSPSPSVPTGPGGNMSKIPTITGGGAPSNPRYTQSTLERIASSASLATQKTLVRSPSRGEDGRDSIRFSPTRGTSFDGRPQTQPVISTHIPTRSDSRAAAVTSHGYGDRSSSLVGMAMAVDNNKDGGVPINATAGGPGAGESEQRWLFRLRELERRLKAEREARLLDRNGARKRLEEGERREGELRGEIERMRIRKETGYVGMGVGIGGMIQAGDMSSGVAGLDVGEDEDEPSGGGGGGNGFVRGGLRESAMK